MQDQKKTLLTDDSSKGLADTDGSRDVEKKNVSDMGKPARSGLTEEGSQKGEINEQSVRNSLPTKNLNQEQDETSVEDLRKKLASLYEESEKSSQVASQAEVAQPTSAQAELKSSLPVSTLPPQKTSSAPTRSLSSLPSSLSKRVFPSKSFSGGRIAKIAGIVLGAILILGILFFLFSKYRSSSGKPLFGKKGELVWWSVQFEESEVAPLIEEYEKINPGIKITFVKQLPIDYRVRLKNALINEKGPDIFEIHNTWPIMFKTQLSSLPSSVMSAEEYTQTFYPIIVSDMTAENGIVGIPLEYDALTLFINEDIFSSAIKVPPQTWDELKKLVDPKSSGSLTIKDKSGIIQSGVAWGAYDNVDHWPEVLALMLLQNRVNFSNLAGKLAEDVVDYYQLIGKEKVWDWRFPSSTNYFARGKVAMYFGPAKRAFEILEINPNLNFRTVPLPQLPKENPEDPNYSYATYWVQAVWENSENKNEAWEFLKFLSSKDSLDKFNESLAAETGLRKLSPRLDSVNDYTKDSILGSIVSLMTSAKSWYLADETYDGTTGVNSKINKAFKNVVDSDNKEHTLTGTAAQVSEILAQYELDKK